MTPAARVLIQGMLQAGLEPEVHAGIGLDYKAAYLPIIEQSLPSQFTGQSRADVAELVLIAFRGALLDSLTTGDMTASLRALGLLQATLLGSGS